MSGRQLIYAPAARETGGLCVLVAADVVVAMGRESLDHVPALWDVMGSEEAARERVVEYVLGVGLRSFPRLVIAHCVADEDRTEVILRGDVSVVARLLDGTTASHSGEGARTWRDVALAGVAQVTVNESKALAWLPLRSGAVLADAVSWELDSGEDSRQGSSVPDASRGSAPDTRGAIAERLATSGSPAPAGRSKAPVDERGDEAPDVSWPQPVESAPAPGAPLGSGAPVEQVPPVEPVPPVESAAVVESAESAEPVDSGGPVATVESADLLEPLTAMELSEALEPAKAAEPVLPEESAPAMERAAPVEPITRVVAPDWLVGASAPPRAGGLPRASSSAPQVGLIGSVPLSDLPHSTSVADDPDRSGGDVSEEDHQDEFDRIFGDTRHGSVEDAAVRAGVAEAMVSSVSSTPAQGVGVADGVGVGMGAGDGVGSAAGSAGPPDVAEHADASQTRGDHDGLTISREDLEAMKRGASSAQPGNSAPRGRTMRAIVCPTGHPNPPHQGNCRVCGALITGSDVRDVPAVAPGVLVFSDGRREALDGPIVIGRQPRETGVTGQVPPRLVSVPSPEQLLSRSHVAVRVEGWSVTVTDLGTGNGTEVTLPGERPQRLRGGQPCLIVPGTIVDLAGEVVMTYEVQL